LPHGSLPATLLNEQGWNGDSIDRELAHGARNAVRTAYNFAQHLPERSRMMQSRADTLEELRTGGTTPTCGPAVAEFSGAEKQKRQKTKTRDGGFSIPSLGCALTMRLRSLTCDWRLDE